MTTLKDSLLDIVHHTQGLGFIDLVKIVGENGETNISGMADDRTVVVQAKFHTDIDAFANTTFGMPNLKKLNTLLSIPEYAENANIELTTQDRGGETVPVGIHFENATGDFKNDYRFMNMEQINERLKTVTFRGAKWNIEFQPTAAAIQRFKYQIQANSDEDGFIAKTDGSDLVFYFGDHSTHAGNFVFQPDVTGEMKRGWKWPVSQTLAILSLPGDITMKFSDEGAAQITVDSGIASYNYILPAKQ